MILQITAFQTNSVCSCFSKKKLSCEHIFSCLNFLWSHHSALLGECPHQLQKAVLERKKKSTVLGAPGCLMPVNQIVCWFPWLFGVYMYLFHPPCHTIKKGNKRKNKNYEMTTLSILKLESVCQAFYLCESSLLESNLGELESNGQIGWFQQSKSNQTN